MQSKLLYIFLLIIINTATWAQFSLNTEYAYLTHINSQNNKSLITDNLRNAEMTLQSLRFTKNDTTKLKSRFYLSLANSHFLLNNYENVLFLILEQRSLFPLAEADEFAQKIFMASGSNFKIPAKKLRRLLDESAAEKHSNHIRQRHLNAIELQIKLNLPDLDAAIGQHIASLSNFDRQENPHAVQQWQFYKQIGLKHAQILPILDFTTQKPDSSKFYAVNNVDLMLKILQKAVRHYIQKLDFETAQQALTYTAAIGKDKMQLKKYQRIQKRYYRKSKKHNHL